MTVFHNEGHWDTSNVVFADGTIRRYDKKELTPEMQHIDYGLGILRADALAAYPDDEPFDLADVYRDLSRAGQLAGYEVRHRFYEIGSHHGLAELDALLRRSPRRRSRPRHDTTIIPPSTCAKPPRSSPATRPRAVRTCRRAARGGARRAADGCSSWASAAARPTPRTRSTISARSPGWNATRRPTTSPN